MNWQANKNGGNLRRPLTFSFIVW